MSEYEMSDVKHEKWKIAVQNLWVILKIMKMSGHMELGVRLWGFCYPLVFRL